MRIVAGSLRGFKLQAPNEKITRPTSDRARESVFNVLSTLLVDLDRDYDSLSCLDVFAGSGALGFEALSRGVQDLTLIERHPEAIAVLHANAQHLKVEAKILRLDALKLPKAFRQFNLIFLDPPYKKGFIEPCVASLETQGWLAPGALLVIEFGAHEPPPVLAHDAFHLLDDRTYGAARIQFYQRLSA
ncbi:MAG: 16S rRNA (guanine(966)-N(2))-methyltransferase RsmD [Holosporales bacterium]